MEQGKLELRSGSWEWRLQEADAPGGERRLRLRGPSETRTTTDRAADADEMMVRLERQPTRLTAERVRSLAQHATSRRFEDAEGVHWTAELRRPKAGADCGPQPPPMVLFSSEQRACLITLRPARGLGEMTTDELRTLLDACLNG